MYPLIKAVVIILVIETLHFSVGYKWISLQSGDKIPQGAIHVKRDLKAYVGRARHYDEILPAKVHNCSYALIWSCSQETVKHEFEVLVSSELCKWEQFNSILDMPENIVRAGSEADGEPIYVWLGSNGRDYHSLLSGHRITKWIGNNNYEGQPVYGLTCDDNNNWVDTSSRKIPNNTISGGQSADGNEIFVARLKRYCDIIPGQVIPYLGIAMAVIYEGIEGDKEHIESTYCQVLVGDQSNYSWVWAFGGEIPDHAVVNGKSPRGELRYVARVNKTLTYIEHNRAKYNGMDYEILVRN